MTGLGLGSAHTWPVLTLLEKVGAYLTVCRLPIIILFNVLFRQHSPRHVHRPLLRVIFNSAVRFITAHVSWRQLQYLTPGTRTAYAVWAHRAGLDVLVDELRGYDGAEGAALMWVGERRVDRVLVYCHGGAFMTSLSDPQLDMCRLIQQEFTCRSGGKEIGVAVLHYSLYPSTFPTQLTQLTAALSHLLASGVSPSGIYLLGDSAGANLILQLLSHTLHPYPSLPPSPLSPSLPLGGACLVSPWTALRGTTGSFFTHADFDIIQRGTFAYWGMKYLEHVPDAAGMYVEAGLAPVGWFKGWESVVGRVLVTAGGREMLRDDAVLFGEVLRGVVERKAGGEVRTYVSEGGLHDDPIFDIAVGVRGGGDTTGVIMDWLVEG